MINARDAYWTTLTNKPKPCLTKEVEEIIERAIREGRYSVGINFHAMRHGQDKILKKLGYKVEFYYCGDIRCSHYDISWKRPWHKRLFDKLKKL